MTYDELKKMYQQKKIRKPPSDEEHQTQVACVNWFRLKYPKLRNVLFAIPNGGRRDKKTGTTLKEEGVVAGVADLILLKRNQRYGALCVEMKTKSGSQSETQKKWQKEVEATGNKYVVCRSLDEFMKEITDYLNDK